MKSFVYIYTSLAPLGAHFLQTITLILLKIKP